MSSSERTAGRAEGVVLATVLLATYLSAFAASSYLADRILGRLPFHVVALAALGVTVLAWRASRPPASERTREGRSWLPLSVTIVTLAYLLIPTPHLFPLSLDWDGAVHIAIANYLAEHGSHTSMEAEHLTMLWGDEIFSYPWGMHAFVAYLARVTGGNAFAVVFPLVAVALALTAGSMAALCERKGASRYAIVLCLTVWLLSKYGLFHLIQFDFWSQAVGTLLVVAVLHVADDRMTFRPHPLLPALLLGGVVLVYPLFAPVVFSAFLLYALVSRRFGPGAVAWTYLGALAVASLYVLAYAGENVGRVTEPGPDLLPGLSERSGWLAAAFHAALLPLLPRILRTDYHYLVFPLATVAIAVFLSLVAALGLVDLYTNYYSGKLVSTNLILLVPAVATCIAMAEGALARAGARRALRWAVLVGAFAACVAAAPKRYMWRLAPALGPDEYAMRLWTQEHLAEGAVHYAASPYKVAWVQAIAERPRVVVGRDFRQAAIAFKKRYRPPPGASEQLARRLSPESYVVVRSSELSLPERAFREVKRFGDVVLYQRRHRDGA